MRNCGRKVHDMTLQDLRNVFREDTVFVLKTWNGKQLQMTNLLWGNLTLIKIQVWDLEVKNNKIIVNVDMPNAVFKAWKKYSDKYYAEGR